MIECDRDDCLTSSTQSHRHSYLDKAAAFGFLSVVEFLCHNSQHGGTGYGLAEAAVNGHTDVIEFLWVHDARNEEISYAIMRAACARQKQAL